MVISLQRKHFVFELGWLTAGFGATDCQPTHGSFVNQIIAPIDVLLRLPAVLAIIPVSRAAWWRGISRGAFPPGIKLGPRTTAWRASDISKLVDSFTA